MEKQTGIIRHNEHIRQTGHAVQCHGGWTVWQRTGIKKTENKTSGVINVLKTPNTSDETGCHLQTRGAYQNREKSSN
jgi:hypothetical protein